MRAWLLAIALVMLALVRPASADDAEDREEARREFAAGQAADRQHDWKTAIEHYMKANDLVPHPNAMFNIATDFERLGNLREAGVWYQKYIDKAKDSPDRDKVIRLLRELQLRPGTITVRTTPSGARVIIDNSFAGVTPYSNHIKGGAHKLVLELGALREEREIKIEFGEPVMVDVPLRGGAKAARAIRNDKPAQPERFVAPAAGPAGTLRINGEPAGALVTIDDRPTGSLPFVAPLAPGAHKIRVTQYGFTAFEMYTEIRPNEETVVDAQLTRALGSELTTATTPRVSYLFGAGAGVDTGGEGGLFLLEAGVRSSQYDVSARIGKTAGLTAIDLLVRWTLTKSRISPWICGGYSFITSKEDGASSTSATAGGYILTGGLRFDLTRGEHYGMSLIAESGIRYYSGLDLSEPGEASDSQSGLIVPVMTSLQITYR